MNTKKFMPLLASAILLFSMVIASITMKTNINPIDKPIHFASSNDFKKDWAKVDSLDSKGLPKSALEIVDKIYKKAYAENNAAQVVKARIYQLKYRNSIEEDAFEKIVTELAKDAKIMHYPYNSIFHSVSADLYWMYYQNNRWKFSNRSETLNFVNDDIKTWDLNKLADVCIKHYLKSLENEDSLKRTPVSELDPVLNKGQGTVGLRPTLYDFLAFKAVDFFSNKEISLSRPADKFELKDDIYFASAAEFVKQNFQNSDTLSLQFYGIKVLQKLLAFHIQDSKPEAFIDADMARLSFVYHNSVNAVKDSLYLESLKSVCKKYDDIPFVSEPSYRLASLYNSLSSGFDFDDSSTYKFKNYKNKAIEICNRMIQKYPEASGSLKCKNLKEQIENRTVSFETEDVVIPGKPYAIKLNYLNLKTAYVRITSIEVSEFEKLSENNYGVEYLEKLLKACKVIKTKEVSFPEDNDYNSHSVELMMDTLPYGHYVIFVSQNKEFNYDNEAIAYKDFMVTDISYMKRRMEDGTYQVYVTHRNTGEPLKSVLVQEYYSKYNYISRKYVVTKGDSHTTDENGFCSVLLKYDKDVYNTGLEFHWNKQILKTKQTFYNYRYNNVKTKTYSTILFTDRAIYRPGQTVYYKGVVVEVDGDNRNIARNFSTTLSFKDPNYQSIQEVSQTTNEFGTFNGTLQIPQGLLNGQFQLVTPYGTQYISVEEYKRPKFIAEVLPFNGSYKVGDSVEVIVKGTAYSGPSISDAQVTYRVVRTPVWRGWWWRPFRQTSVEITNGKLSTDEKGELRFKFKAIPDLSIKTDDYTDFDYQVFVDITDINGETQSASRSVTVGYTTLQISTSIPEMVNATDNQKFYIYTTNLNGENVGASGNITISKLENEKTILRNRLWQKTDKYNYSKDEWEKMYPGNIYQTESDLSKLRVVKQVFDYSFDTHKENKFEIKDLAKWDPGRYVINMNSVDSFGKKVINKKYIVVFSEKSTQLPYATPFWAVAVKRECEPGESAKFLVGSGYDNAKVLVEIEHKGEIVLKQWYSISKGQMLIEVPVIEKHRGNFAVHFRLVSDNRYYSFDEMVYVPYSNKTLKLSFETFRDKLLPGEQEEWKIKITGPKGEKVAAEMVAALYDKSLDALKANYWDFSIYSSYYMMLQLSPDLFTSGSSNQMVRNYRSYSSYPYQSYDQLNWFGFYYYSGFGYGRGEGRSGGRNRGMALMAKTAAPPSEMDGEFAETEKSVDISGKKEVNEEIAANDPYSGDVSKDQTDSREGGKENVKVRTNLNETAFFYPTLATNENGEVIVKFTVPEALTKWKMMGFAHTQNLEYGFINNELVTQKELMVVPNLPRFFRENDKMELSVKISNLTEKEMTGQSTLEFIDPITMKPVAGIITNKDETQTFSTSAKGNTIVTWSLSIPEGINALAVKVVAVSGKFSDGEQSVIPVMSNRMLVTESLPLPVRGNQSKTFEFKKLMESGSSSTLKSFKYTLEFTSNPAWYAVQALPYLIEYPYECSEQLFSRFYANSLATHIANSSPKIKSVFDSWKNTTDSKALLSNLEKNQELKSVLLQETPWVLDAQDETQRKRNVGLLFDLNRMSSEMQMALSKLEKAQSANGGWPWFQGMPENRYITQHIITGFGHLQKLKVVDCANDNKLRNMVTDGVSYLDDEIRRDYNNLLKYYTKEELQKKHIGSTQIQYLYCRSFFTEIQIPNKCKEAFDYFKGQAEKFWLTENKYLQGMMALGLHRYGSKTVPQDIIKSLKENSITHDELGMYWKDVEAGYYWWNAPIETEALLIEAFDEVSNDQKAVEEMKIWLLKQKQTQDWKTTKATVEAIYALLLKGTDLLADDQLVEIVVGDQKVDPKKMDGVNVEAGTGYFKTSWLGNDVKPEMGKVKVTKNTQGVAWGAVYWQYFEQLDKITPHETPLKLKKELFVERLTSSGKVIEPLASGTILKVGDKVIVRIELRVDRTMEFVHMKDMRAAAFEPMNVISTYKYQDGLGYYETTKDASTNFFMDYLPKGTYVFEYPLRTSFKGNFSNGITSIQCMYAPEFSSHSQGDRVGIE
jgi:uncharacterized protein YfaS (alpha-2-macroglobulin family)